MMLMIKMFVIVLILVILTRRKINLGLALMLDAAVMGFMFNMGLKETLLSILKGVFSFQTFELAGILVSILFLENIMRKKLFLEKILTSLQNLVGDYRAVAAMIPPFIGLLPSAGGALFSAPLVQEAIGDNELSPERKAFINYWFRHVWEYMFPLYPGVILASRIIDIDLVLYVKAMIPFTLAAILIGIPISFYRTPKGMNRNPNTESKVYHLKNLLFGISPILFIIFMFFVLKIHPFIGIGITILALTLLYRYTLEDYKELFIKAFSFKTLFLVLGVMVFKNMLVDSGVIEQLPAFLTQADVPVLLMFFLLPFTVGVLTGISTAYVAVTFPILAGLLPEINLSYMAFAYVSGFAGVMVTPIHLCMVFSANYYKAKLGSLMVRVMIPQFVLIAFAFILTVR
ncbi:hypothetical protein H0A61_01388 [Koleobacter methoxysyntrophicus]|uniref:DUF401 family protein n=1 Tax=Koleobacter methoxysyntrophicus TaxID=2751313 RepID=A0A8A0RKT2_9FIRM|nr:DUF401 family protein [Koleobacter methoxysyntrophicus]QSQ09031.1 hypothetical protein H0A61_01388 [Koleobacter methoxysyntrophicus]